MWYNPFYSIVQFRVTTLRYRPKEAVPIEPNQQRHISTDGVKTTAGATGQPGAPAPKNKKKPKKRRSIIGMIFSFIGCMLCLCIMAASVGGVLLSMYIVQVTADDGETLDLDNQKNRQTSIIYDINGNEYASLSRNENRIWRELSAMPENLQNAVIAIEDKNFRTEPGINLKGTIGAALNAFTGNRIWGTNRGASTLEQQLIKNLTGDSEQDNMRKVREIFRALGLDNKYSKETILEAYLNTIPLTGIIHGMEAGSIEYFGKHVEDLTLAECATLASITKNPTKYNPATNPEELIKRRNHVLYEMYTQGYITEAEFNDKLLREDEKGRTYIDIDAKGLLRADTAARTAFYKEMFYIGAMNPNEIRASEDMDGYEGGDQFYHQANMEPVTGKSQNNETE